MDALRAIVNQQSKLLEAYRQVTLQLCAQTGLNVTEKQLMVN
jgi:hypothetical protein